MTQIDPFGRSDVDPAASGSPSQHSHTSDLAIPMLTIVSHPDPTRIGAISFLKNLSHGGAEYLSRHMMDFYHPETKIAAPLNDPFLSRDPISFSFDARGDLVIDLNKCRTECKLEGLSMVKSRKVGAFKLGEGISLVLADRITLWLSVGKSWNTDLPKYGMIGDGAALSHLCKELQRVVDLDMTILLRGELGTGKEIVARTIHQHGHRSNRPFVVVKLTEEWSPNSAAKWFGAVQGEEGKHPPVGYFTRAHRGTLYLDEITSAHPDLQKMLLRVLETGQYLPVGSTTPRRIDFRVMAATVRDIKDLVAAGKFLEPLFNHLTGYVITVPSLTSRREDLGRMFCSLAKQTLEELGLPPWLPSEKPSAPPWLPPNVMLPLLKHAWPGNLRQLRKLVRQLIDGSRGQSQLAWTDAAVKLLGWEKPKLGKTGKAAKQGKKALKFSVREARRPSDISEDELLAALRRFRWNFKAAAAGLGISRASLYQLASKCKRIRKADSLDEEELRAAWKSCHGDLDRLTNYFAVSRLALRNRLKSLGLE